MRTTSTAWPSPSTNCSEFYFHSAVMTTLKIGSKSSLLSPHPVFSGWPTIKARKTWRIGSQSTFYLTWLCRSPRSCPWTCWSRASRTHCWETRTILFTNRVVHNNKLQLKRVATYSIVSINGQWPGVNLNSKFWSKLRKKWPNHRHLGFLVTFFDVTLSILKIKTIQLMGVLNYW